MDHNLHRYVAETENLIAYIEFLASSCTFLVSPILFTILCGFIDIDVAFAIVCQRLYSQISDYHVEACIDV